MLSERMDRIVDVAGIKEARRALKGDKAEYAVASRKVIDSKDSLEGKLAIERVMAFRYSPATEPGEKPPICGEPEGFKNGHYVGTEASREKARRTLTPVADRQRASDAIRRILSNSHAGVATVNPPVNG